jgi:UDP-N-acetylmuramate dehydrogenase
VEIQTQIDLAPLSWMKVGGPADYYAEVKTAEELKEAFAFANEKDLPLLYIGQGSNMVIPDEGIRGLVIRLMNDAVSIDQEYSKDHALVETEAGKILSRLIRDCRQSSLNGLDNFVGIPGTVGAAVRGNIGIPEEEFGDIIKEVTIFDGKEFKTLPAEECDFRYRGSLVKDEYWLVWSVQLLVRKGDPPHKDEWLLQRVAKQPKGHSCGSFFKNPDPNKELYAGKLVDECGLKGKKIGGAFVSEKHGNFLMNDGTGTAAEILQLAREVRKKVKEEKGIVMDNEVLLYDEQARLIEL